MLVRVTIANTSEQPLDTVTCHFCFNHRRAPLLGRNIVAASTEGWVDFNRYVYTFDPNRPEQVILSFEFEGGDMTGGELGADEIVFDLNPSKPGAGEEVVEGGEELSDQELRAMWLRQVQTTPGDFLKAKFAYQQAMRQADAGGEDE